MIIYLLPILTTLTLLAAGVGVYLLHTRKRHIPDRLQRVVDGHEELDDAEEFADAPLPIAARLVGLLAWLWPTEIYSETLKLDLSQAGCRHRDARKVFTGSRIMATVFVGLFVLLASWQLRMAMQQIVIFSVVGAAVGFYLPLVWLRVRQSKRQMAITLALPDALDLLVICVEAGQGLNAALLKVGNECSFQAQDLGDELKTVNNEMLAGVTRAEALRNFALRTGVPDVRALVGVMIQSDRFGTSIAQALRTHADSLRTKRRQRAEEAARKTPVKLVFPLVFCIFPELMVVILAPGMLELFRALQKMAQGE